MPELENPTRRYKWFRPRQASRGYGDTGTPTNYGTVSLFNDSFGDRYLVVRDFQEQGLSAENPNIFVVKGALGTVAANATVPLIPSEARLPGAIYTSDEANPQTSPILGNATSQPSNVANGLPFVVLPPGWSLAFQAPEIGKEIAISIMWEAIFPDELDFMW